MKDSCESPADARCEGARIDAIHSLGDVLDHLLDKHLRQEMRFEAKLCELGMLRIVIVFIHFHVGVLKMPDLYSVSVLVGCFCDKFCELRDWGYLRCRLHYPCLLVSGGKRIE